MAFLGFSGAEPAYLQSLTRRYGTELHSIFAVFIILPFCFWICTLSGLDALFIKKKITQSSRSCCTSYLVGTVGLQSLWSLSLAIVDIYALLVRQRLRNPRVVSLFTIGDGVSEFALSLLHNCML